MPGNEATLQARHSADEIPATSGATHAPSRRTFRNDDLANVGTSIMTLVIVAIVILFVGFLLFESIAPDTTTICTDTTNYTADECSDAQSARGMFFTILVISELAILLTVLGIAVTSFQKGSGNANGGGGRRSSRRRG